jgi:hypothetical protein
VGVGVVVVQCSAVQCSQYGLFSGPRYFAAYYWAMATMTTIGYGEFSPTVTHIFFVVMVVLFCRRHFREM